MVGSFVSSKKRGGVVMKEKEQNKKKKRKCLGCGKVFVSKGPWNRLCRNCRERAAEISPSGFVVYPVYAGRA
jgi:uncharacterized OB-fold protein